MTENKKDEIEVEKKDKKVEEKKLTLKEKYALLQKENEEIKDKWIRTAAEFDNFRRRSFEEKSGWIKNATERLVLELCDVVDNFERALHPENKKQNLKSFKKGIDLIYQQLDNVLKKEGVTKIEALEKEFDPNYHEALAHIPSDLEENIIVAVIQNGYLMNEKVIRAARVAVSNGEKPKKEKLATNKNKQ